MKTLKILAIAFSFLTIILIVCTNTVGVRGLQKLISLGDEYNIADEMVYFGIDSENAQEVLEFYQAINYEIASEIFRTGHTQVMFFLNIAVLTLISSITTAVLVVLIQTKYKSSA